MNFLSMRPCDRYLSEFDVLCKILIDSWCSILKSVIDHGLKCPWFQLTSQNLLRSSAASLCHVNPTSQRKNLQSNESYWIKVSQAVYDLPKGILRSFGHWDLFDEKRNVSSVVLHFVPKSSFEKQVIRHSHSSLAGDADFCCSRLVISIRMSFVLFAY